MPNKVWFFFLRGYGFRFGLRCFLKDHVNYIKPAKSFSNQLIPFSQIPNYEAKTMFVGGRNRFTAWRAGTTTLFDAPARHATYAGRIYFLESISGLLKLFLNTGLVL